MATTNPPPAEEWSEQQLVASLKTLDDLHKRLIALRTVIPTVLHPLFSDYATPVDMYDAFATGAQQCSEKIAGFNRLYVGSQDIFRYAAAIRAKGGEVERLKGWELFLEDEEKEEEEVAVVKMEVVQQQEEEDLTGEFDGVGGEEGVRAWAAGNTRVKVELEGVLWKFTLPPPVAMTITVELNPLNVVSVRSSESPLMPPQATHSAILRALNGRKMPGNLRYLLEMIDAYTTVFTEKCGMCGKLMGGPKVEPPVVRRYVKAEKKWVAAHEGCV